MDYTTAEEGQTPADHMATATTQSRMYRPLLLALGIVFAALGILYSAAWMYYVRRPPPMPLVEVGFDESYSSAGVEINNVYPNSPAEKSGLKVNDRIVAINGSNASSASAWNELLLRTWLSSQPGDTVTLTLQRPGQSQPLVVTPRFRGRQGAGDTKSIARTIADQIDESYPLLFLVVGLAVLFLRVEDRNAWLLALVFATFIAAADMPDGFGAAPPNFRSFLLAYRTLMGSVLTGLFYFFLRYFPRARRLTAKFPG
jgi:membrane-associated protease RseP (regulator of RpoE activity)